MSKKRKIAIAVVAGIMAAVLIIGLCLYFFYFRYTTEGGVYGIEQIDLSVKPEGTEPSFDYLYNRTVIDFGEDGEDYLAHPDSILLDRGTENERVFTSYVKGHGKGELVCKITYDGLDYGTRLTNLPDSWKYSEETPPLYELNFTNGDKKLIMVSANPKWKGYKTGDGFNVSQSDDGGQSWSEFRKFYGINSSHKVNAIVAMSSLTRLKENGRFVDKWMGLFHDDGFRCYKTVLTFDDSGNMQWSDPEELLKNSAVNGKSADQRFFAKMAKLCEMEVIRSDGGSGDVLCILARCESHRMNSFMTFSFDEGRTWTQLKETPSSLDGHRHKAEYLKDGRLFITFRGIERNKAKLKANGIKHTNFFSSGWIAWVGTFDDLVKWYAGDCTAEGQYRVKLAHTYNAGQTEPCDNANGDTGYAGLVVLKDGTVITSSYGKFDAESGKTYIVSKRINMDDLDALWRSQLSA